MGDISDAVAEAGQGRLTLPARFYNYMEDGHLVLLELSVVDYVHNRYPLETRTGMAQWLRNNFGNPQRRIIGESPENYLRRFILASLLGESEGRVYARHLDSPEITLQFSIGSDQTTMPEDRRVHFAYDMPPMAGAGSDDDLGIRHIADEFSLIRFSGQPIKVLTRQIHLGYQTFLWPENIPETRPLPEAHSVEFKPHG